MKAIGLPDASNGPTRQIEILPEKTRRNCERRVSETSRLLTSRRSVTSCRLRVVMDTFDKAEIRQVFQDDADAILDLIGIVSKDLPRYAALLIEHVRCGEWADVHRLAHTIMGAACNVSAREVVAQARAIELAAKQGRLDSIVEDSHALARAVGLLVRELHDWAGRLRTTEVA